MLDTGCLILENSFTAEIAENAEILTFFINHRLTQIGRILFLPADADLAAAFSIPVSAKPAASVRRAIRDGPHKNMQAGKKRILLAPEHLRHKGTETRNGPINSRISWNSDPPEADKCSIREGLFK